MSHLKVYYKVEEIATFACSGGQEILVSHTHPERVWLTLEVSMIYS